MNEKGRQEILWEFFKDIIVPVIMGVCSIIVAISANNIAKSANETAKLQALIAKNAEAPTIEVIYTPGGYENDASIKISILDGKYSNFKTETASFLSLLFLGDGEDSEETPYRIDIPMSYFIERGGSQVLYGEIWECSSRLTAEVENLRRNCNEYYNNTYFSGSEEKHTFLSSIAVVTCLKCTYLNLLEEEETVYYFFGSNKSASQISQDRGEKWFQKRLDMFAGGFFLNSDIVKQNDAEAVFRLIDTIRVEKPQYISKDFDEIIDWMKKYYG